MSREVFRVPLGFDWPLGKGWWGFLLDSVPCGGCEDGKVSYQARPSYEADDAGLFWCSLCDGEGEARVEIEPPKGEGYQMWETTTNGSPISPPFESPEELARWLVENSASVIGRETASYEEWLSLIRRWLS